MKLQFEEHLYDILELFADSRVKAAAEYSLLAPGKRVRPLLLMALLKDFGFDPFFGLDAGAAIEMVHTYSLIHDDLPAMDNDDYRRGRLTNHRQFDEATAILAGDGLLTSAFELLATSAYSSEQIRSLVAILARYSGLNGMVQGQMLDIIYENETTLDFEQLEHMYRLKTGGLLAAPLEMACVLADREKDIPIVRRLGENLGVAFQVQDDIFDVVKSTQELGKSAGSDETNHKVTALTLLGFTAATELTVTYYRRIQEDLKELKLMGNEVFTFIDYLINRQI